MYGGCYKQRQVLMWCVYFSLVSLPGCNKNHWQNSVEPNQPTKGEFFLFVMDCLLRNMCILSSGAKMKPMLHCLILSAFISCGQASEMWMIWSHWCNSTKYQYAIGDLERFRFILSCFLLRGGRNERAADRERARGMWCCLAGARDWMGARGDLCSRDHLSSLSGLITALRGGWLISGTAVTQPILFCVCVLNLSSPNTRSCGQTKKTAMLL